MTDREKAIVMAYTGKCTLAGDKLDVFYQYLAEKFGRPIYTHELLGLDIEAASREDFLALCREGKPTADVVEVVRCRECKYWNYKKLMCKCPEWTDMDGWHKATDADDYCFRAERKEKADETN